MPGCRVGLQRSAPTGNGSALEVVLHDHALYKSTFTLLYFISVDVTLPVSDILSFLIQCDVMYNQSRDNMHTLLYVAAVSKLLLRVLVIVC